MGTTWIIVLSFLGFLIVFALITFLLKRNKKTTETKVLKQTNYENNFIKLKSILDVNHQLQKSEKENISLLNNFIEREIKDLQHNPEYVFNYHVNELNTYVIEFIDNNLIKNTPSIWGKKFNKEITILNFKTKELENKNSELENLELEYKNKLSNDWISIKETKE